ncbi:unnamed protein product [Sphagnum compactum]
MMWRATGSRSLTTTHGASCAPPSLLRGSRSLSFHLAACRSSLQQQQQFTVRFGKLRCGRDVKQHTGQLLQEKGRLVRNCHEFGVVVNLRCCALQEPRSSAAIPESVGGGGGGDEDGGFTPESQETGSPRKLASAAAAAATQESEEGGGLLLATSTANTSAPSTAAASYSAREIWAARAEDSIEKVIFDFRFLTLLAIGGSLAGSLLCFLKGCGYVYECFNVKRFITGKVLFKLVEAVDVYLFGTVLLIFGMGVYGLFISNVSSDTKAADDRALQNTSLFGLFLLKARPKWMCITSLDELKTKLGHVIVMILLVKMFEKSKRVLITSSIDLLGYSLSIFLSSTSLYVLHRLHHG